MHRPYLMRVFNYAISLLLSHESHLIVPVIKSTCTCMSIIDVHVGDNTNSFPLLLLLEVGPSHGVLQEAL